MLADVDLSEADATARRILAEFSNPFTIKMTHNVCGASIGYAIAPTDGSTLDALLRNADLALYEAKRGRAQIVAYTPALSHLYDSRVALEHDLQFALPNGELEIEYQPIVDPRSGRAICCEALLEPPRAGTDCSRYSYRSPRRPGSSFRSGLGFSPVLAPRPPAGAPTSKSRSTCRPFNSGEVVRSSILS